MNDLDYGDIQTWLDFGMTDEQARKQLAMVLEGRVAKNEVLQASVGDAVTAPRGGEPCIVATIIGDGRLVSHDGGIPLVAADWCTHSAPNAMYFEYVGGASDGQHGWYDAHDACRRVFQWG